MRDALGLVTTGCSTTKRIVTNGLWFDDDKGKGGNRHKLYLSYWEGTCRPRYVGGCSRGDSHVKHCSVQKDNSLSCENNGELDALLSKVI